MAYQTPITIKAALDRIWKHDYVLPAIQREFVWDSDKICRLFDSLMQGFPVGSFLFWKIEKTTSKNFRFFDFVREYHQRDNPHCPPLGKAPDGPVTAVLDGQQRLTALNIGLRGSMAVKEANKWWNNPNAFPTKRLYLNLLYQAPPDEEGTVFWFEFLTEQRATEADANSFWFPVYRIFEMLKISEVMVFLSKSSLGNNAAAVETLHQLHSAVHSEPIITFYEEESQSIEKVLNIFIRTNSGGTVLSYSDLLLSIATAQWEKLDARTAIHSLVDELNRVRFGFDFSKDFVLKAGLMLSDISSVGFKVENFNSANMQKLENNWQKISDTLKLTVQLIAGFGLSRDTIRADSALLPVAYYLHKRQVDLGYLSRPSDAADRDRIKFWIIRSLIKSGIWGSALDVLLTGLRDVIRAETKPEFPVDALEKEMRVKGKTLTFTDEELQDLVDIKYGNREVFGLMTLLFPFVDTRNQFHIDHIFPQTGFHARKLQKLGFDADKIAQLQEIKDSLPNLQLLEGAINQSKGGAMPKDWFSSAFKNVQAKEDYFARHMLEGAESDLVGFEKFFKKRRAKILARLVEVLNGDVAAAAPAE